MTNPSSEDAPMRPAKEVTANSSATAEDAAPPAVSSSPSADTRGGAGTSTAEGPRRPKADVPSHEDGTPHAKRDAKSEAEVSPPGPRVDDENEGTDDKRTTRQE